MSESTGIIVHSCTIAELFGGNGEVGKFGRLAIPEYQRPYVWGEKHLLRLVDDVESHYRQKQDFEEKHVDEEFPMYYLGSLILHKDNERLNIIDGQQRITTMLLIAFLLEMMFPSITFTSPVSLKNIRRNWRLLENLKNNNQLKCFRLDEINVTLVITQSEDDAYTFFETQNTGGVRLSGADIIKSHHLRALTGKLIRYNALRWEGRNIEDIEYIVEHLTKVRYWNYLRYKVFPFYKNKVAIKSAVVDEFTEQTKSGNPVSYLHTEIIHDEFGNAVKQPGGYKAIRQPLYNGSHFVEFITEYVDLYWLLFKSKDDHRLEPRFYSFRNSLLTGLNSTVFLKELFEMSALSYVSKFGLKYIYEFSLWAFRFIYSLRVITARNVREDSMAKFAKDNYVLDKILNSYSHEEVVKVFSDYTYDINTENISKDKNTVKKEFIMTLEEFFKHPFINESYDLNKLQSDYDKDLVRAIQEKLAKGV